MHEKILNLIKDWAIQFAGESDIMPIFTDKFEELQSKGIQFPSQEQQFKSHKQI